MGKLTKYFTFMLMLHVCVNTYKYNFINRSYYRFVRRFFLKGNDLQNIFKCVAEKKVKRRHIKELMLFITNFVPLLYGVFKFYQIRHISMFLATFRRLIALVVELQWSLCMNYLNVHIIKLRYLMKTVFVHNNSVNSLGTYMQDDVDVAERKIIDFSKIDTIIEAYRLLTDKHRILIDYYGFHIVSNSCVMLLSVLLSGYYCWIQVLSKKGDIDNYCVFAKVIIDLVNIVMLSLISESSGRQVTYSYLILNQILDLPISYKVYC